MTNTVFEWQLDEFMIYCRSRQLREKTMASYEQTLRLFERWCKEEMRVDDVDKITESMVRRYINDLQTRGKYSFYSNDTMTKEKKRTIPTAAAISESRSAYARSTITFAISVFSSTGWRSSMS